jgi:hypothetical protein
VVGSWNSENIRHRATMAATRLSESESTASSRVISVARAKAPVTAGCADPAGHLKRHEHPFADTALVDLASHGDHLANRLVPDSEWPREQTAGRHRPIEIASSDGERTHERAARVR